MLGIGPFWVRQILSVFLSGTEQTKKLTGLNIRYGPG